jgi:Uma2 family endonuclease
MQPPVVSPEADHRVVMHAVDWRAYEVMLVLRGERDSPRMIYLEGALELMSPSRTHENIKKLIASLFEAHAMERGLTFDGYGSMTMRSSSTARGLEPDECYALGGRKERPDLAIEVIWTSGGLDRLEVHRGLGVREVWIWESNTLTAHALRGDRYAPLATSELVPDIDLALIARLIAAGGTQSDTLRAYHRALTQP